jgi:hypothetical protein
MKTLVSLFVLTLSAAPTAGAPVQEVSITVDPARSGVEFTLGDVLHTVHGTFKVKGGTVKFSPLTGAASGSISVDVASGNSGGGARDRRMHKEILESDKFPVAVFSPDRVTGGFDAPGEVQAQVHGILNIHGKDHEVTIPARINLREKDIAAEATFSMPYVKWGMKNPSTFVLRVNENVELKMTLAGKID